MNNILEIKNLHIGFNSQNIKNTAVKGINFAIEEGKTTALVGESGSGKSVTALSILKLLPSNAFHNEGEIIFNSENLLKLDENDIRKIRGKYITSIFQEPMTSLNPLHTIEKQITEILMLHNKVTSKEASFIIMKLLQQVGLEELAGRIKSLPHELSGGQRQRVMIAMSIANKPKILIADEPTTALDVTIQDQILNLLKTIQKEMKMAMLFISHNLAVVRKMADYVCIMKDGEIVEQNEINEIFKNPKHKYTKELISAQAKQKNYIDQNNTYNILKIKDLRVWYPIKKGILRRTVSYVKAVNEINFSLKENQTLGIVGESGSGKTTLVLALLRLIKFDGEIEFKNLNISSVNKNKLRKLRKEMQIVFQDPFSSLSPRMTIEQIIKEGLDIHQKELSEESKDSIVYFTCQDVGLNYDYIKNRYPHEFSGGQRQRIAIARALVLKPKLIIFDEPTSALDVSIQTQILDLLNSLQEKNNLTYIFISHDLKVIKAVSDEIIVMKDGQIIEIGKKDEIINNPKNDYTKKLLLASL